jgi:pyruvate/2-oxoglutarate dehydrogenase complex dihydrolipoamide acyltransferase (E2) component
MTSEQQATASPPNQIDALHIRRKALDAAYLRRRAYYPKGVLSKRLAAKFEDEVAPIRKELAEVHATTRGALKAWRDAERPPVDAAAPELAPEPEGVVPLDPEAEAERMRGVMARMRAEFKRRIASGQCRSTIQPTRARAIKIRRHRSPRTSSVAASASDSSGGDDPPPADSDPPSWRANRASHSENLHHESSPWLRLAHESRRRVLDHLVHERRPAIRGFLLGHVQHLERVIRSGRVA